MSILFSMDVFGGRKGRLSLIVLAICFLQNPLLGQHSWTDADEDYTLTRGRGYSNLSFSLDQRKAENEDQLLRTVLDQDKLNYRITTAGGIALKDNFTVGLGISYGRQRQDITFLNEEDEEVTSKSVGQDISFIPNFRKYIPLGAGKFQIFVQTDLRISLGESLQRNFLANDVERIDEDFTELRLGVQPGLALFFTRNWAFETSVGIAGLSSRWTTKTVNNDTANQTKIQQSSADLRLNLLTLNLGVAYYFN